MFSWWHRDVIAPGKLPLVPLQVPDVDSAELSLRIGATGILVIDACLALVCILKGKYRSGLFGLFLPPVGFVGAVRLARPNSIWARHRYRGKRLEHATRRAADFDRRWKPVQADWEDFIGGRPSQPNPPGPAPQAAGAAGGGAAPDEPARGGAPAGS